MGWGFDGVGGVISSVWNTAVDTPINNALAISAAQRNQRYAREQMDWQKDMSNTAHQREVADLRAAGLNPILSATGGSGASTPTGQSGSIAQAQAEGFDAASAKDLIKYLDSQREQVEEETGKTKAEKNQTKIMTPVLKKQAETASAKNIAEKTVAEEMATGKKIENDYWKNHPTQYAINKWIDTISNGLNSATQLANITRLFTSKVSKTDTSHYNKHGEIVGGTLTTTKSR